MPVNIVYDNIKIDCKNSESNLFAVKEVNLPDKNIPYLQYTIELILKDNLNSDDYGLVFSLNLEDIENDILISTDIIRSFGEMLKEKKYLVHSTEDLLFYNNQLNDAIDDIKTIPDQLFVILKV